MSAHDKQMVLHQTLQQLQQLGGSADPDNMLAVSDQELVDHTNVVTDQDLFIVVENDEQSAEVIVNPNGNRGMIHSYGFSIKFLVRFRLLLLLLQSAPIFLSGTI